MLSSLVKPARVAALVGVLAIAGCFKSDQTITVYPDGSGKIQAKATVLGMMAQMIKMGGGPGGPGGGPDGEKADPFDILKQNTGDKVYWTNLKAEDGPAGEYILSGVGYFEDMNQIVTKEGEKNMSFKKEGDGYVFEMKGQFDELSKGMPGGDAPEGGKMSPEQEQQQKQMLEMMKGMMAGFDMKMRVVMPGTVKSAIGLKAGEGREASFALGEKEILAIMDKKQEPPKEMRVVSGPADDKALEAEIATFKKELADAKVVAEQAAAEKKAKGAEKGAKKGGEGKPGAEGGKAEGGEKKPAGGEKKGGDF